MATAGKNNQQQGYIIKVEKASMIRKKEKNINFSITIRVSK